jgi:hypothetical protein
METEAKVSDNRDRSANGVTSTAAPLTTTRKGGAKMADPYFTRPLARPNASFTLHAQNWLASADVIVMSCAERGRLFMDILKAVDARDEAFLARYRHLVPSVCFRDSVTTRPPIPSAIRRAVLARDGRRCVLCGSDYKIEIDHFIPYSKGGLHTIENLRVLCKPCNRRKSDTMPAVLQ